MHKCLVSEVEFINNMKHEESVWTKVRSERRREALYIYRMCVYLLKVQAFLLWIVVIRGLK